MKVRGSYIGKLVTKGYMFLKTSGLVGANPMVYGESLSGTLTITGVELKDAINGGNLSESLSGSISIPSVTILDAINGGDLSEAISGTFTITSVTLA